MNILFYNTYPIDPEHGGTERVTDLVAHYLKSIGYTIYYLVRVDMGKSLENADIRTFFLPEIKILIWWNPWRSPHCLLCWLP